MPETSTGPYEDDDSISDDDYIFRRVGPDFWDPNRLDAGGVPEMRSNAFQAWTEARVAEEGLPGTAMSVALQSTLEEGDCESTEVLAGFDSDYGLARIRVRDVRAIDGLGLVKWPTEKEPWHAMVFSSTNPRFTKGQQRALKAASEWAIVPLTQGAEGGWDAPQ